MPLQKILFKPGVNKENTRYTTEGGWYEADKIRFRQGNPEVIGGWQPFSAAYFQGVCRSLWNWVTLGGNNLIGVGTNLKFYINQGGAYYDITPIRTTSTISNPFVATNGSATITVTDTDHDCVTGDFVTFSGAVGLGGNITAVVLNAQYQITVLTPNTYTFTASATATATDAAGSPGGGVSVIAAYQINVGPAIPIPLVGWGAGSWGEAGTTWGDSELPPTSSLRLWNQINYGQDLVYAPRAGSIYYWTANNGVNTRGVLLNSLGGAVTISLGSPTVITASRLFTEGTPLQFGGDLPVGMTVDTTYYVFNVNGLSFNLLDVAGILVSTSVAPPLIGNVARGGTGTMTASVAPSAVTAALTGVAATGALGGTSVINLTLSGVSASGDLGSVNVNGSAVTSVSASGEVGTVGANVVLVALTGNTAYANVGSVGISGSVVAYISRIVDIPTIQNCTTVSDVARFVIAFGCNDYGSNIQDPMLIRWSAQDDIYNWTPDPTNQAGFARISHGSEIVTTIQTRQEVVMFTDSAIYSLQYLGPPYVWVPQLLGDNISIMSPNAAVIASGVVYWMGVDKFYQYDGRVNTLNCDLRRFVFGDLNQEQASQVFSGTSEGFNEVWWFYCSANSTAIDKYVIYNYVEKIWYYGTMSRTAWLDSGLQSVPIAANYVTATLTGNLINHETGLNDNTTGTAVAIDAYISSSEFDIGDGHNFGFVWRVLPDLTFENAENTPAGAVPAVAMTLQGLANSGSGVTSTASQPVSKSSTYVITEQFTGTIFTRMRGRQMIFKISSNQVNTCWQLGAPRIDIRPDGRR